MNKPLLILTRPAHSNDAFVATLPPDLLAKVDVLGSPLMRITSTGTHPDLAGIAGVIFSSSNGVAHAPKGNGLPAYCIGTKTTQAALAKGWTAQTAGQDADALVEKLLNIHPQTPLLHISGRHKRGDIAARLTNAGLTTAAIAVYDQTLLPLTAQAKSALAGARMCIVPLFSPRTAAQFEHEAGDLRQVIAIALSTAVADALAGLKLETVLISTEPTATGMRLALETAVDWDTLA